MVIKKRVPGTGFAMTYFLGMSCLLLNKCVIARPDPICSF